MAAPPSVLDEAELARGVRVLARRDPDLARLARDHGRPPLWARAPGFPTLVHIVLEQQVSLASAQAAFNRLQTASGGRVAPDSLLRFDDAELKAIGFSRQKAGYARGLARAVLAGELDLDGLAALDDEAARAALIRHKGLGPWTADIYLLMALRRPDIWPSGDLALAVAVQEVKGLPARPTSADLAAVSAGWRPWRAVAARLFWRHYLRQRGRPD
ncbi:MAG: DNA-3-methyladenine glycosylase 2 family protein [Anaerolineales bacterium]|nr:DNA-3-methyladenine glycosylase 2 family protein [Anaerolineales bacterium]